MNSDNNILSDMDRFAAQSNRPARESWVVPVVITLAAVIVVLLAIGLGLWFGLAPTMPDASTVVPIAILTAPSADTRILTVTWPMHSTQSYVVDISANDNARPSSSGNISDVEEDAVYPIIKNPAKSPLVISLQVPTQITAGAVPSDLTVVLIAIDNGGQRISRQTVTAVGPSGGGGAFAACVQNSDCKTTKFCNSALKLCTWEEGEGTPIGSFPAPIGLGATYTLDPQRPDVVVIEVVLENAAEYASVPTSRLDVSAAHNGVPFDSKLGAAIAPIVATFSYTRTLAAAATPDTFRVTAVAFDSADSSRRSVPVTVTPKPTANSAYAACEPNTACSCRNNIIQPISRLGETCELQCCDEFSACSANTNMCLSLIDLNEIAAAASYATLDADGGWQVLVGGVDSSRLTREVSIIIVPSNAQESVDENVLFVHFGELNPDQALQSIPTRSGPPVPASMFRMRVHTVAAFDHGVTAAFDMYYPVLARTDVACREAADCLGGFCYEEKCAACTTFTAPPTITAFVVTTDSNNPSQAFVSVMWEAQDQQQRPPSAALQIALFDSAYNLLEKVDAAVVPTSTSVVFPTAVTFASLGPTPLVSLSYGDLTCQNRQTSSVTSTVNVPNMLIQPLAVLIATEQDDLIVRISATVPPAINGFVCVSILRDSGGGEALWMNDDVGVVGGAIAINARFPGQISFLPSLFVQWIVQGVGDQVVQTSRVRTVDALLPPVLDTIFTSFNTTTNELYPILQQSSLVPGATISVRVDDTTNYPLTMNNTTGQLAAPLTLDNTPTKIALFYSTGTNPTASLASFVVPNLGPAVVVIQCDASPTLAVYQLAATLDRDTGVLLATWEYSSSNNEAGATMTLFSSSSSSPPLLAEPNLDLLSGRSSRILTPADVQSVLANPQLHVSVTVSRTACGNPSKGAPPFVTTVALIITSAAQPVAPLITSAVQGLAGISACAWDMPHTMLFPGTVYQIRLLDDQDRILQTYPAVNPFDTIARLYFPPTTRFVQMRTTGPSNDDVASDWTDKVSIGSSCPTSATPAVILQHRDTNPDGSTQYTVVPVRGVPLYSLAYSSDDGQKAQQQLFTAGGMSLEMAHWNEDRIVQINQSKGTIAVFSEDLGAYVLSFSHPKPITFVNLTLFNMCGEEIPGASTSIISMASSTVPMLQNIVFDDDQNNTTGPWVVTLTWFEPLPTTRSPETRFRFVVTQAGTAEEVTLDVAPSARVAQIEVTKGKPLTVNATIVNPDGTPSKSSQLYQVSNCDSEPVCKDNQLRVSPIPNTTTTQYDILPATANSAYVLQIRNIENPDNIMTVCLSADGLPIDFESLTNNKRIVYTTNNTGGVQTQLKILDNVPTIRVVLQVSDTLTRATLKVYTACMSVGQSIVNL